MTIEHWVEYLIPGSFFSESQSEKLDSSSPSLALGKMPQYAFAFKLYDVGVRTGKLKDGQDIVDRKRIDFPGTYYPQGELVTFKDDDDSILACNIRNYETPYAVKTRRGNHQPFWQEKDVIL